MDCVVHYLRESPPAESVPNPITVKSSPLDAGTAGLVFNINLTFVWSIITSRSNKHNAKSLLILLPPLPNVGSSIHTSQNAGCAPKFDDRLLKDPTLTCWSLKSWQCAANNTTDGAINAPPLYSDVMWCGVVWCG